MERNVSQSCSEKYALRVTKTNYRVASDEWCGFDSAAAAAVAAHKHQQSVCSVRLSGSVLPGCIRMGMGCGLIDDRVDCYVDLKSYLTLSIGYMACLEALFVPVRPICQ